MEKWKTHWDGKLEKIIANELLVEAEIYSAK